MSEKKIKAIDLFLMNGVTINQVDYSKEEKKWERKIIEPGKKFGGEKK